MQYNFNNEVPIYLQIVEIVMKDITNGILKGGEKIPSVREYAMKFTVNPNTIVKSLQILEENKLIYTDRTNGKFVTKDTNIIKSYREKLFEKKINYFLNDLKSMGYDTNDIINKIKEIEK
jgi:DNA-binding transcriptional regulator YhcF (GntR family)